jgi:peptide deformylase
VDLEAALFAGFANGGSAQFLAAVDIAAGKYPESVPGLDGSTHEDDAPARRLDDGADRELRVEIEHEAAPAAHEPFGLARLQAPRLEPAAARRAEAILHYEILPGMAILKVARMGHPVLRAKAKPIDPAAIKSAEIQQLVDDMFETMREYQGVGLAAPQIHVGLRLFVAGFPPSRHGDDEDEEPQERVPLMALINPEITPIGTLVEDDWEGCLSIPDIRGKVPRAREIQVRAYDRSGKRIEIRAKGFTARVIQHETDHLDGVLFFDRMKSFETLTFLDEFGRYWNSRDVPEE